MPNPFSAQYIDEYLDPEATLHAYPISDEAQAEKVADELFTVFVGDDSLEEVGTVEQLAAALLVHYTEAALADCQCDACRWRRTENQ
jgi:hypothetical protein